MPTVQFELDRHTSAQLSYLAELSGRGRMELLSSYVAKTVSYEYEKMNRSPNSAPVDEGRNGRRRQGRNGQRVRYDGNDARLETGRIYLNYAQVLRIVRPDLEGLLWNPKARTGTTAPHLLKRHEPGIYSNLTRVSGHNMPQ